MSINLAVINEKKRVVTYHDVPHPEVTDLSSDGYTQFIYGSLYIQMISITKILSQLQIQAVQALMI